MIKNNTELTDQELSNKITEEERKAMSELIGKISIASDYELSKNTKIKFLNFSNIIFASDESIEKELQSIEKAFQENNNSMQSTNLSPTKLVSIYSNLIDNFSTEAKEKLQKSAIFAKCFYSLQYGINPYQLIEDLCKIVDDVIVDNIKIQEMTPKHIVDFVMKTITEPIKLEVMGLYDSIMKKYDINPEKLQNLKNKNNND
jgi:hypothetical protein